MEKKFDPKSILQFWNSRRKIDKLWILLAVGLGFVLLTWPSPPEETAETKETVIINAGFDYETAMENRLEEILSQIEGVGQVQVMVTLEASEKKIIQMDTDITRKNVTENDSSGGSRSQLEVTEDMDTLLVGGNSSGEPYVVQEISPKVEGVIVLAEGGEKATVRSDITEAIQALFSLEAHKIKVFRRD